MIDFFMQIMVAIFGVLFEKAINNDAKNVENSKVKKIIEERVERIEVVHKVVHETENTNSDDFILWLLGVFLIMFLFVKYHNTIIIILSVTAIVLELIIMYIVYDVTRRGWRFSHEIQSVVVFNMISLIFVLGIIILMKHPLFVEGFSSPELMRQIEEIGLIKLIWNSHNLFSYIISQMASVFILIMFFIMIIPSNISLYALIRVNVTGRTDGVWGTVYNKIATRCRKTSSYIKRASNMLLIAFFFMSGAFVKLFEWITKCASIITL